MPAASPELLLSISDHGEVTGIGWKSLSRFFDLPPDLKGLRTLDVCSGLSDFAHGLRQRGAEAYALDLLYGDFRLLTDRHKESFREIARDVFHTSANSPKGRQIYEQYVRSFRTSLKKTPSTYIAGSATHLPFADSSFDLVTSFNGLFGTLDFDARALEPALLEVLRVIKPGGCVQLIPYQRGPILDDHQRQAQRDALEAVRALEGVTLSDHIARDSALLGGSVAVLTITKQ
jgi:SAM-dependent methyltransferase